MPVRQGSARQSARRIIHKQGYLKKLPNSAKLSSRLKVSWKPNPLIYCLCMIPEVPGNTDATSSNSLYFDTDVLGSNEALFRVRVSERQRPIPGVLRVRGQHVEKHPHKHLFPGYVSVCDSTEPTKHTPHCILPCSH